MDKENVYHPEIKSDAPPKISQRWIRVILDIPPIATSLALVIGCTAPSEAAQISRDKLINPSGQTSALSEVKPSQESTVSFRSPNNEFELMKLPFGWTFIDTDPAQKDPKKPIRYNYINRNFPNGAVDRLYVTIDPTNKKTPEQYRDEQKKFQQDLMDKLLARSTSKTKPASIKVELNEITIDGQVAWALITHVPKDAITSLSDPLQKEYYDYDVVFVRNGMAWKLLITLAEISSSEDLERARKLAKSIHFL